MVTTSINADSGVQEGFGAFASVPANAQALAAVPALHTYHCPCTTFLIATTYDLLELPRRQGLTHDHTIILPLTLTTPDSNGVEPFTLLQNMKVDLVPIVIRREDGFESRTLYKCQRCQTTIGYTLSSEQKIAALRAHQKGIKEFFPEAVLSADNNQPCEPAGSKIELSPHTIEELKSHGNVIYIFPKWVVTTDFLQKKALQPQDAPAFGDGNPAIFR